MAPPIERARKLALVRSNASMTSTFQTGTKEAALTSPRRARYLGTRTQGKEENWQNRSGHSVRRATRPKLRRLEAESLLAKDRVCPPLLAIRRRTRDRES